MATTRTDSATAGNQAVVQFTNQYLTFLLAGEEYGVGILDVQEVKAWEGVTQIPNAPAHVKGVLDLRGMIVPIVDLRIRFGLPSQDYTATTVIIVLKLEQQGDTQVIGIVVDAVSDVMDVTDDRVKDPPEFANSAQTRFLKGLASLDNKLVILLNTDKLLSQGEMDELKKQSGAGTKH
jgi:purine-binding chemotaxis protein CheW